ncbi:MAG: acetylornithine deacetylase or succinyl-diaminopimelate desuccinylase [Gemmatimonadetes bacterium]|nr:acetylornithine deacetylase or succinyl-diaminopimelate desuccinylase [Gemmatimonadota bacterium]
MSHSPIARGDALALTRAMVRVDSRNPTLVPGAPGEARVALLLRDVLQEWGFRTELHEAAPGRMNVIARIGTPGERVLMFNGHLDVVGVEGMTHEPFTPSERDGALFGRGSADMKGGVAAMCAAAARAGERLVSGEVLVAAVIDEEWESLGTRHLISSGVRADAAIVTEPTRLAIMPAHRGFAWVSVIVHGRAAHGSRWDIGVDAVRHAGLLLAELDRMEAEVLPTRAHPLLGRPSLHASLIEGGTGMSTYPETCTLKLERRTIPGEGPDDVLAEVREACARVKARSPSFSADVSLMVAMAPSDVALDAPVVQALQGALERAGRTRVIEGMSAWTDCALLNEAGIPAVCFGPGDISLAHAAEEFVPVAEIELATRVLEDVALRWCAGDVAPWRS